jgi:MOSC domain-containing protein YiiM
MQRVTQSATDHRGTVQSLHLSIRTRQPMRDPDEAMAVPGAGLLGCRHSRPGNERAVLLVESETLAEFGLQPGEIKEHITTRGIDLTGLKPGAQLQVGETVSLEVTGPCAPCHRMDEIRHGLQADLQRRRGINARVQIGGKIRPGDEIAVIKSERSLP